MGDQCQHIIRHIIDKYNKHVHFVISCTTIHKVIDSLQSRTIIMTVPNPTTTIIREIAHHIIDCEPALKKIMTSSNDSADALEHVITLSNNTIRIFINYIEKLYILDRPLTVELSKSIYTNICWTEFERYTEFLLSGNLPDAIKIFYALHDHGYSVIDIIETYFSFLKTTTILNEMQKYKIIALLCKYITIFHNVHEDEIELALFTNNAINEIKNDIKEY